MNGLTQFINGVSNQLPLGFKMTTPFLLQLELTFLHLPNWYVPLSRRKTKRQQIVLTCRRSITHEPVGQLTSK